MSAPKPPDNASSGWRWSWQFASQLSALCTPWQAAHFKDISLLWLNEQLALELGLDPHALRTLSGIQTLAGQTAPADAKHVAQAYAGHQFGHYNPRLGDGRALLLGEHRAPKNTSSDTLFDIHLKGSGPTPYSRGGDGFAGTGPMLREALMGEALHSMGIPSTRALAVLSTGQSVYRQQQEPGAILVRLAQSHLRVGTFQYASALCRQTQSLELLQSLTDFAIERHYPHLLTTITEERSTAFFSAVVLAQAQLIAQWMAYGFIHGVMNTDNMSISGETIDFGPCAMLEHYDPQAVFSSIDHHGRYAFGEQPPIAIWNLARLGESLLPLIAAQPRMDKDKALNALNHGLSGFMPAYEAHYYALMQNRLGLSTALSTQALKSNVDNWLAQLADEAHDYTLAMRQYSNTQTAPLYIPRNHLVEAVLKAAKEEELSPFKRLMSALQNPFVENKDWADLAQPASKIFTTQYQTFCGT